MSFESYSDAVTARQVERVRTCHIRVGPGPTLIRCRPGALRGCGRSTLRDCGRSTLRDCGRSALRGCGRSVLRGCGRSIFGAVLQFYELSWERMPYHNVYIKLQFLLSVLF